MAITLPDSGTGSANNTGSVSASLAGAPTDDDLIVLCLSMVDRNSTNSPTGSYTLPSGTWTTAFDHTSSFSAPAIRRLIVCYRIASSDGAGPYTVSGISTAAGEQGKYCLTVLTLRGETSWTHTQANSVLEDSGGTAASGSRTVPDSTTPVSDACHLAFTASSNPTAIGDNVSGSSGYGTDIADFGQGGAGQDMTNSVRGSITSSGASVTSADKTYIDSTQDDLAATLSLHAPAVTGRPPLVRPIRRAPFRASFY